MKKIKQVHAIVEVDIKTKAGREALLKQLKTKKTLSKYKQQQLKGLLSLQDQIKELKKLSVVPINKQKYSKGKRKKQEKLRNKYKEQAKLLNEQLEKQLKTFLGITKSGKQTKKGRSVIEVSKKGKVKVERLKRIKITGMKKINNVIIHNLTDMYAAILNKHITSADFDEWNISAYFTNFVSDTSAGWARRFMEAMGVDSSVSRHEFYNWMLELKAKGLV